MPVASLDVAGNIKIKDGTQGAGKVLTSDANGLASWAVATGGSSNWTLSGNNIIIRNTGNVGIGVPSPDASLSIARGIEASNTIRIKGTTHSSNFNFSTDKHTYIRGGKATSDVIVTDQGRNVGIGAGTPNAKLHVKNARGVKIPSVSLN